MSVISDFTAKLFGGKGTATPKNATTVVSTSDSAEIIKLLSGNNTDLVVSERTALTASAVYASVGLIGGAIASLPFHIYKRTADGRERYDTPLWWLFNESPTKAWTSAAAWQYALQNILLKGDSIWTIDRVSRLSPEIVGFTPYHRDHVQIRRLADGSNVYDFTYSGSTFTRHQDDVLHFTGLGFNGIRSLTPIDYALGHATGTSNAADKYAGQFFVGGARPDHAIEVPANVVLSTEQKDLLKSSWSKQRDSYNASGTTPVLTGGMKVVPLTLNAQDAQLLETRQFGVEEIARIFGVPPHMIGKTDASTSWGSGIEQMSIGFVRYTLRRHLDAIQQEINRKLWPRSNMIFGEFNTDALMDGDSKAQAEYFGKALGGPGAQGWMTTNEVRKLKNLPPIDGGDKLVMAAAQPTQLGTPK